MATYDTIASLEVIFREIKPEFFMEALLYSSEMWGVSLGPDGKPVDRISRIKAPGPDFYIPIRYATEMGVGAIDESSLSIPTASPGKRTESHVYMKWMAASTEITDIALKNVNTDAAIRNYAADKLDELKDALVAYYVRAFTWNALKVNASNWALGVVGAYKVGSSNMTINNTPKDIVLLVTDEFSQNNAMPGAWYIKPGMRISFQLVTNVSRDKKTITVVTAGSDFTLTANATYVIFIEGSFAKEPTSFDFIASEGRTLQGLDTSDFDFWNGVVTDADDFAPNNGLTVEMLVSHLDSIRNTNIGRPNVRYAFTTLKQIRNLISDFINTYNYQPNRVPPRGDLVYGGWGIEVEGVEVRYDPWVPPKVCYTPSYDTLTDYYIAQMEWRTIGGKIWYPLENELKHRAVLLMSRQLATSFAGHQGKIINLGTDFFD